MWPFFRKQPERELSPTMSARVDALEEKLRLQERGLKALELDWQEWFDKFRLLYARLSKRIKDAAEPAEDTPQSTNPRAVAYDRPYRTNGGARPSRSNYGG